MTIDCWVSGHARFSPDKTALIFNDRALSYRELDICVNTVVRVLGEKLNLRKGDRIAYTGFNHPEMLMLLFAAARLGIIVVPINCTLAPDKIGAILKHSATRVIFHDTLRTREVRRLLPALPGLVALTFEGTCEGSEGLQDLKNELDDKLIHRLADQQVCMTDPYLLVYTPGTTGEPKGVLLTQQAVLCTVLMSQHMHDMTSRDHILTLLPLFQLSCLTVQLFPVFFLGACVTLQAQAGPGQLLAALDASTISLLHTEPRQLQAAVQQNAWARCDKSSLRAITLSSTEPQPMLINRVLAHAVPVIQVYGTIETGSIAIYQRIERAFDSAGSIGRGGLHCDVRLLTPEGFETSVGQIGEICVKGENVSNAYWGDADDNSLLMEDGWLRTGDAGSIDAAGDYWFVDRLKHVIICGDRHIYAAQIERVLRRIQAISDVVVAGRPQAEWGEVPVAVVVRRDNCLTTESIQRLIGDQLAHYELPRDYLFVDELPRDPLGQVIFEKIQQLVDPSFECRADLEEYSGVT